MVPSMGLLLSLTFEACVLGHEHSVSISMSVADETNKNLMAPQKELLLWHCHLGYANMQWIQQ